MRPTGFFQRLFSPPPSLSPGGATALRERILSLTVLAAAFLGIFAHADSILQAVRERQWIWVSAYGLVCLWLLVITFVRRLPYGLRAGSLLLVVFALGPVGLVESGLSGDGRVFLLAFPVLACLLFGLWGGLASLTLSLISLGVIGWLMSTGRVPLPPNEIMANSGELSPWLSGGVVFLVLGAMVTVALAAIVRGLEKSLEEQGRVLTQLREDQSKLESHVAERSGDVERQRTQIQTAAEIAKLATETQDTQELMSRAVELIRDRFDFYHASAFLLDATGTWAELVASTGEAGRQLLARKHRLAVGSASIVGWVTANLQARVALNVEKDPFHFRNPLLPGTRAEMAVPIMVGSQLIGALDVQSTQADAFSEVDVRALEAIAAELAIASENARLLREARATLERAGRPGPIPWSESWARLMHSGQGTVVHFGAAADESQPPITASDRAARSGEAVVHEGGHEIAVPILVRGEVVATIAARKTEAEETFGEEDLAVLQAVASQAAQALDGARQYSEEQRRLAELEVVNRVSQAASQLLNLDALYRILHTQIAEVLGPTDLTIALCDEEQRRLSFPYVSEDGEVRRVDEIPLENDLVSHVIRTRQPMLLVEDAETQVKALGVDMPEGGIRSWLGVPMMVGESNLGAIVVQDRARARRFTDDDAALLSTIASQVATALENARLLEQVRRTARRQRLIHEITSRIRRAADMDTILATAARELSEGLSAAHGYARVAESGPGGPTEALDTALSGGGEAG